MKNTRRSKIILWDFTLLLILLLTTITCNSPGENQLLTGDFKWKTGGQIAAPVNTPGDSVYSIKDPSIVRYNDKYHLFCTIRGQKRSHAVIYLSFKDWKDAHSATQYLLPLHAGYYCAPQVFYFTPHKKWYMICQAADDSWDPNYQPAFSTTEDIADPESWSGLTPLFNGKPDSINAWLDFWVICDEEKAFLFFTSLDGKMWRSVTSLENFPFKWSQPVVALEGDIFEASHTYKLKGGNKYLTVIEAQHGYGWRYFKAYVAVKLDGPWQPLAADKEKSFASMKNVRQTAGQWTESISHGELIRAGYDEKLEVEIKNLTCVFQGVMEQDRQDKPYGAIPWRLGLLEPDN